MPFNQLKVGDILVISGTLYKIVSLAGGPSEVILTFSMLYHSKATFNVNASIYNRLLKINSVVHLGNTTLDELTKALYGWFSLY